jgi:hypothetical protein
MRRTRHRVPSAIALGMWMASWTAAFAQVDRADPDGVSRTARTRCELSEWLIGGAPVLNAPFSAEATVWRPPANSGKPELRATARYCRDASGRVRLEQAFVGSDLRRGRMIVTPDVNGDAQLLDPIARTASVVSRGLAEMLLGAGGRHRLVLPLSMNRVIWFIHGPTERSLDSDSAVDEESGLPDGVMGTARGERWVSPDLKLVVYSRSEDATIGIVEYRLTNISRVAPRADLFEVSEDQLLTPFTGPLTWENPYPPRTGRTQQGLGRR